MFVDTSALGSVYLHDEADAARIGSVIFEGPDPVVISEIADVELASLLARARRDGRIDDAGLAARLDAYTDHTSDDGPIGVVPLTRSTVAQARHFVLHAKVRTLDALHLATARHASDTSDDDVAILTSDSTQAVAAKVLGFTLLASGAAGGSA